MLPSAYLYTTRIFLDNNTHTHTLIAREYVQRKAKTLHATAKGLELIARLPVPTLRSAELTGAWEARLGEVAQGTLDPARFMEGVHALTHEAVAALRACEAPVVAAEPIGVCPRCRGAVAANR